MGPFVRRGAVASVLVLLSVSGLLPSCKAAKQPPYVEVIVLEGTAYERGFQHGQQLASKIQSLYTMLIETSIIPYLNREQKDVASILQEYQAPQYDNGEFSYQLLLQSAQHLEEFLKDQYPQYVEEMHGISDGSGVPYEKVLILNTFVDTMMAFRTVTLFVRQLQAPRIVEWELLEAPAEDGLDNNGDGQTDEADDWWIKDLRPYSGWLPEYGPKYDAAMVEVPTDSRIRMILYDPPGFTGFIPDPD